MVTRKQKNLREKNGRCFARTENGNRCKRAAVSPEEQYCSIDSHNENNHIHKKVNGLAEQFGLTEDVTESKDTNDRRLID